MVDIGTATIKVLPDVSEFEPALREHIRRIVREELDAALNETATAMMESGSR